ncbi:MAG: ATP-binding protein [Candidatus Hodarchaeales archaeon]
MISNSVMLEDSLQIPVVRKIISKICQELRFSSINTIRVATVTSEILRYFMRYENGCTMGISIYEVGVRGICLEITFEGNELHEEFSVNVSKLRYKYIGFISAKRLMDECNIISNTGKGTRVTILKYKKGNISAKVEEYIKFQLLSLNYLINVESQSPDLAVLTLLDELQKRNLELLEANKLLKKEIEVKKEREKALAIKDWAINSASAGFAFVDGQGKIFFYNPAFEDQFKLKTKTKISKEPFLKVLGLGEEKENEIKEKISQQGRWRGQVVVQSTKGKERVLEIVVDQVKDQKGQILCLMIYSLDISYLLVIERERRALEQKREDFIQIITHELLTPLTIIRGYVDLLEKKMGELEPQRINKILNTIRKNTRRLQRLVKQVNEVTMIEKGLFSLEISRVCLQDFLQSFDTHKQLLGDQFVIKIEKNLNPRNVFLEIDFDRMTEVFDNIIINAIKHTSSENRLIKVGIESNKKDLIISITDNGAGIKANKLPKIFGKFASFNTKYSVRGSGIGLFLSKIIVEEHGGEISAISDGLDCGATFKVKIPMENKGTEM